MSLLSSVPEGRRVRSLVAWIAAVGVLAGTVLVSGPVSAATVDLVVNVSSDRGVYDADGTATYTVRVDNRGSEGTSVPSTVTLTAPNTSNGTAAWESSVTCAASNGAVCPPTAFSRVGTTISGSIPSIPVAGSLVFTVSVPGNASNFVRGSVAITATIAPTTGDTDAAAVTDSSSINVLINDPRASYLTTVTGPATTTADSTASYDVLLSNTGTSNSVYTDVSLAAGVGTGTASSAPIPGLAFTGVSCVNETGGALCSNLRMMSFGSPVAFNPEVITANGLANSYGVTGMPAGSSVTLRFTVNTGRPLCTDAPTAAARQITLSSLVDAFTSGYPESADQESDNAASVVTNVPALPCATGDISTVTLTQPTAQQTNGVVIGGPFEYTALYSNLAGDVAVGADILFSVGWPGTSGSVVNTAPSCVAAGGAVCPTAWSGSGASIRGSGASLPINGTLSITFSGTGGGDDPSVCRPQRMLADTLIVPPLSFKDTNYVANSTYLVNQQSHGNNGRRISTTTNVGSPCLDSHDDAVQQLGPFSDPAATIPLVGTLKPGQVVYFRASLTNQTPSPAYTAYSITQGVQLPSTFSVVSNGSDPGKWFRHHGSDPAGIMYRANDGGFGTGISTVPFDTGVRCEALGGAVCPSEISANSASGGAGELWISSWGSYWNTGTQPTMPEGSSLSFISSYKVPELNARYQAAGCVPIGVNYGTTAPTGSNTLANVTINASVSAATVPATRDRSTSNDSTSVTFPLEIKRCDNPLAVTKTALTPSMPADRLVKYRIVAKNTSVNALDLPRLIDSFSTDAPATITCDPAATTLGALCPTFSPQKGERRLGDGTIVSPDFSVGPGSPLAQFDFAWGTAGQPTMPPGSTVTFEVAVQYPTTYAGSANNSVYFAADPGAGAGLWQIANASASVTAPQGSALALAKTVTPVSPKPGGLVTFSVDIVNSGAAIQSARFVDTMNAVLAPTNPAGFSNLQCRPLTAADNVLDPTQAVGSVACPTFTSDATGISGVISSFAANGGLRLTYTAIAPLTASSIPNIALLTQSDTAVTRGDTFSQANFLVMTAKISGKVWDDANGSAAGTFENIDSEGETPTNAGGLNAVLVDAASGEVIAVVPVNADGTYQFDSAPILTNVTVAITSANPTPGDPFTTSTLPAGWVATSPLAQVTFGTGVTETVNKDFGIEQPPTTDDKTDPLVANPGGDVRVQVPSLSGDDPEDGELGTGKTFQIVTLPTGGTLYYDGVPVTAGQIISGYDPTKLTVDPKPGAVTVIFTVASIDAAGIADATPATVTMPFSVADAASISGVVWFDQNGNGVRDPGEVGIAGVTVTLRGVDESGASVLLTTVTDAAGAYTFPNLAPGTYQVREGQPGGYADGSDVLGTGAQQPGSVDNDGFFDIVLVGGQAAIAYDFGEVLAPAPIVPPASSGAATVAMLPNTGLSSTGFLVSAGVLFAAAGALMFLRSRRLRHQG